MLVVSAQKCWSYCSAQTPFRFSWLSHRCAIRTNTLNALRRGLYITISEQESNFETKKKKNNSAPQLLFSSVRDSFSERHGTQSSTRQRTTNEPRYLPHVQLLQGVAQVRLDVPPQLSLLAGAGSALPDRFAVHFEVELCLKVYRSCVG